MGSHPTTSGSVFVLNTPYIVAESLKSTKKEKGFQASRNEHFTPRKILPGEKLLGQKKEGMRNLQREPNFGTKLINCTIFSYSNFLPPKKREGFLRSPPKGAMEKGESFLIRGSRLRR
jgi:hypothetical protein